MDPLDLAVIRTACAWLDSGHRVMLATVVATWGSSPRPEGSMMALREDGRSVGSVSGGCIEDDLIARYSTAHGAAGFPPQATAVVRYGVLAEEAHRFGLPCGGTLELVLEFAPAPASLAALLAHMQRRERVVRTLTLVDAQARLERAHGPQGMVFDGERLSVTFGPQYRMLLIGAGALAEYLATMALFNGFAVSICDPRSEHLASWPVTGVEVVSEMPDDAVTRFGADANSCVIALSHDPKLDDLALLEALRSPAFYLGAIGSRANNAARRQRLVEHFGETEANLARLRGPVGIYIGSRTPAEIAVSIMAEVIAARNGVHLPRGMSVERGKEHARTERDAENMVTSISHFD